MALETSNHNKLTKSSESGSFSFSIKVLLLLCFVIYILPGTIGHTPWKQDEAYSFGIIHHMFETGKMLVPMNAGEPFMEKPPLYYWTASIFASLFHHFLPLYDAARLASIFYVGLAVLFLAMLAKLSLQSQHIFSKRVLLTVALYLSTFGMVKHAHDMFTDVALCAGTIIGLYGLQRIVSQAGGAIQDAIFMGLGVGIAGLSKGFFIPAVFVITSISVPFFVKKCRHLLYIKRLLLAALVALPIIVSWPIALAIYSPELFDVWFWDNNVGRFIGFSVSKLGAKANYTRILDAFIGFCFPVGLLSLFYIICGGWRKIWRAEIAVPLLFVTFGLAILQTSATSRHLYLLPFIAPLSVLAIRGLYLLPVNFLKKTILGIRLSFGILALLIWCVYLVSLSPELMQVVLFPLAKWLSMTFIMPFHLVPFLFALSLSLLWMWRKLWLSSNNRIAVGQEWAFGVTLIWAITFTLLLPWIDNTKGYGDMYARMQASLKTQWQHGDCLASQNLGECEAPLLYYFTGILHHPVSSSENTQGCRWLLTQNSPRPLENQKDWTLIWQGSRDGDDRESFKLFKKITRGID